MRPTLRTMALAGLLAIGSGWAFGTPSAEAGCGGSGGYGRSPGHLAARGWGGGRGGPHAGGHGGGCGGGGHGGHGGGSCGNMGGMSMGAMPAMRMPGNGGYATAPQPAVGYAPEAYPQAATPPNGSYAGGTSARAGAQYTCPMHPSVVSATPGSCPYCHMALQRRS